jgi:hypothetical protein
MSNRSVEVKRIATSKPSTFLQVRVSYDDAKSDFLGYGSRVRGYYVIVGLIEDKNDGFIKTFVGRGGKGLLEAAARFNQRRLNQLAEMAGNPENPALDRIVEMVLARSGLQLAAAEPACV